MLAVWCANGLDGARSLLAVMCKRGDSTFDRRASLTSSHDLDEHLCQLESLIPDVGVCRSAAWLLTVLSQENGSNVEFQDRERLQY